MTALALFALLGAVWSIFAGPWYLSLALYLAGGLIWIAHEMQRPRWERSLLLLLPGGAILLLILWPLRAERDFRERWKLRRSPERFVMVLDVAGESRIVKFARFDDAVRAAKDRARKTKQIVTILDQAKLAKEGGQVGPKTWQVNVDGTVESSPKSFF